ATGGARRRGARPGARGGGSSAPSFDRPAAFDDATERLHDLRIVLAAGLLPDDFDRIAPARRIEVASGQAGEVFADRQDAPLDRDRRTLVPERQRLGVERGSRLKDDF